MMPLSLFALATTANLLTNPGFDLGSGSSPAGYTLAGAAKWAYVGYADEIITPGVALESSEKAGAVSSLVHLDQKQGRWVRFSFRGMAEDGFKLDGEMLYMKIDFMSKGATNRVDTGERQIYREVERDRRDFGVNGSDHRNGAAVWRTYAFEELLPFPDIDGVRVEVGFKGGSAASAKKSAFFVDDFSVIQEEQSCEGKTAPDEAAAPISSVAIKDLTSLGGRWYYRFAPGERPSKSIQVTSENADRLYYKDNRLSNPFATSMTSWLRPGMLDERGNLVKQDQLVTDNVVLIFDGGSTFTMKSRNIPNHATAKFPDTIGTQGYNPSYIQEQNDTWKLPLEPKLNPDARALTLTNEGMALPMGTVGVAVNGVSFFNPFDAGMQDATGMMDRCCGHPNPGENRYHYHKYPICVNTPFVDKGQEHSPLIGFAFDGFPVYGPYEAKEELARDSRSHPLNKFNAHYDEERGWHYHVTPGKFPYILGGYMGVVERSNFVRR